MKNIFIIGVRGYRAKYGGWETFVTNLVDNYKDEDTRFYINEVNNTEKKEEYSVNSNVIIKPIYVKQKSSVMMLIYSIKSFIHFLKYIEKNKIENAYIYVLGLKLGPFLSLKRKKVKKLNCKVLINPDGLEHKRQKWNKYIKKFFLYSEKTMLNNCDIIVCDAKGIKEYVDDKYPALKDKTIHIAYGSETIDLSEIDEEKVLEEYGLEKDNYCLMIGRCVPENNYELVINEYMKSKTNKKLVIISNISNGTYYNELITKTNCLEDTRIKFIDGVYDKLKLSVIRKNAYLYIHGHSVGGTNPSLLEALSLTDLNILYDVNFNKDVGKDSCLYFDENNKLSNLLDNEEMLNSFKIDSGKRAKEIVKNNYTWDIIVNKYKEIFK